MILFSRIKMAHIRKLVDIQHRQKKLINLQLVKKTILWWYWAFLHGKWLGYKHRQKNLLIYLWHYIGGSATIF